MKNRHGAKRGAISGRPPENEPWIWITKEMLESTLWRAMGINAHRVLGALMVEHLANGGRENGNLIATHLQLEAYGVTKDDVKRGLTELQLCGFIRLVKEGYRLASGGEPARYAITWQVTFLRSPNEAVPTDDWREVLVKRNRAGQVTVLQVRRWLKEQVAKSGIRLRGQRPAVPVPAGSTQDIDSTHQMRGATEAQMMGENIGKIVNLTPHMRGGSPRK